MNEMVDVLFIFKTTTELISGDKYPTICYIKPLIQKLTTHLTKARCDESACIRDMKSEMLKNLKTRYTDERVIDMLNIAAILDPLNKYKTGNMSSADLLIKTAISVAQTKANTQAEVIHCTEGQEYELLSNFNKDSTS